MLLIVRIEFMVRLNIMILMAIINVNKIHKVRLASFLKKTVLIDVRSRFKKK